jgi:hypothetical protein
VTVDTTVQPKNITFPTDAKLLHAGINGIVRLAKKHRVQLRQSYLRIAKRAAMMAGRYAHAKQFKRHHRQLRLLRTRLGRIIRDVRRKIAGQAEIEAAFEWPLARANQVRSQQQRQRGWKLYSFHAPEVECIGKGKASAPYELMAWTTPALSGNLEGVALRMQASHQKHSNEYQCCSHQRKICGFYYDIRKSIIIYHALLLKKFHRILASDISARGLRDEAWRVTR